MDDITDLMSRLKDGIHASCRDDPDRANACSKGCALRIECYEVIRAYYYEHGPVDA